MVWPFSMSAAASAAVILLNSMLYLCFYLVYLYIVTLVAWIALAYSQFSPFRFHFSPFKVPGRIRVRPRDGI
jgi:hypothetical protein